MDKRKSLMGANARQKPFYRHSTIISTQHKSNHTIRCTGKSMPKIRLTTNDKSSDFRSISSPRLKNFPAEEMRKVDKSLRPNVFPFPAAFPTPLSPRKNLNSGQGDSLPQPTLPSMFQHNHNQTISQPLLSNSTPNHFQHSQAFINSNSNQRSPDRQTHRPFVPNVVRNSNPKPQTHSDNHIFESPITNKCVGVAKLPDETNTQIQSDFHNSNKFLDTSECEKQPVGGRSAAIYRLAHLSKGNLSNTTNTSLYKTQISNQSHPNSGCHQQHQQMLPSKFYYDFYHTQQPNIDKTIGMISPQDSPVNLVRDYENDFNHPQSMIPKNPGLHQGCQHTEKCPGNNRRPCNQSVIQQQHQQQQQEYPLRRSVNNQRDVKKSIQFTPAMIHAQELLVKTMRQQGINEDIMKRHFDALLNEQRRQLIYQQQLEEMEEKKEEFDDVEIQRQRRINKIEEDEKPEWMRHITPSWIPYSSVKKMKDNLINEGKKCVRINENLNQNHQQQQYWQEYNGYANNQQCQIPHQNVYQQWPDSIGNSGHHREDVYYPNNYNRVQNATQHVTNAVPTGILKTRNDDSAIMKKRQQANNGLQDLETVKKAMEELKNAQNQKGYEYLINLNKKAQYVHLNGVQDLDHPSMHNLPYRFIPKDEIQEVKNGLSANGLENNRNFNNPSPSPTLYWKNCNQAVSEYPRQKVNDNIGNYYVMPAEKANGTMANLMVNEYQQNLSAFRNPAVLDNTRYKNSIQAPVCCQSKGEIIGPHNCGILNNLMRSNSSPPNIYSEYQQTRCNDCYPVPENICYSQMVASRPNEVMHQYNQPNVQMQGNIHIPEQFLEARIIGGIKYFPRKMECVPDPSTPEATMGHCILNQPIAFH